MTAKNGNGNGGISSDQLKASFKREYPKYGTIGMTLKAIGIRSRQSFYNWCKKDAAFNRYYEEELKPNRIDELVSTALDIANAGRVKMKGQSGSAMVVDASKPQTDMIKFLLGCFDPEHYSEKRLLELQGKGGGAIPFRVIREDRSDTGEDEE